ncbi:gfo/Idh/MocA family oxidoreductase [Oceanobacillus zhaokaii]|uniref:Gfo/Idh/MocA family oxidoreductase n=1 Tax=Oceanobacillus zhaokaii TaxID=2052660 RepID=A0A345PKC2_9BACI|nr:Gfo/Idh/MocA family oxidoreductase [Oceanobacillus zhaokaii]AXI10452.1 gfo/Idh/MocA family oxidoreductase [Oceanobacillus zhaokaii]
MKIGMISFAHSHAFSYAHALTQLDGVEIAGIADENEERGKRVSSQFNTEYYQNYEDLLDQSIDAVIISSENSKHYEHVVAAAKKGKHILCEKPLAHTIEDAQKIIDVCKEHNVILQTAFPVRFNTPVVKAKQIIESGQLGKIVAIKGTNRGTNPGGWFVDPAKSGGGAVIDHTVHVVDIIRWYTGVEVKEVYAEVGNLISDYDVDDCGLLTMEFDNNMFATLDCSWSRNDKYPTWGDVTLEIVGTSGTLTVDAFEQKINVYNEDGARFNFWGDNMDMGLVEDFITSVRTGKAPSITGEDGLKALAVAIAAYESSKKQEPVKVN